MSFPFVGKMGDISILAFGEKAVEERRPHIEFQDLDSIEPVFTMFFR